MRIPRKISEKTKSVSEAETASITSKKEIWNEHDGVYLEVQKKEC